MSGADRSGRIAEGLDRGNPFEFFVDGEPVQAYPGETIAAALIAAGRRNFRCTAKRGQQRGYYCGIGICWECVMVVNGQPNVRTCVTIAAPAMRVETQQGLGPGGAT
jgi:aerobic-type carbon monoxide dehydrogenase small subunit (CoxS/CutS family)